VFPESVDRGKNIRVGAGGRRSGPCNPVARVRTSSMDCFPVLREKSAGNPASSLSGASAKDARHRPRRFGRRPKLLVRTRPLGRLVGPLFVKEVIRI